VQRLQKSENVTVFSLFFFKVFIFTIFSQSFHTFFTIFSPTFQIRISLIFSLIFSRVFSQSFHNDCEKTPCFHFFVKSVKVKRKGLLPGVVSLFIFLFHSFNILLANCVQLSTNLRCKSPSTCFPTCKS